MPQCEIVLARQRIPANLENFRHHLRAVAHRVDSGSLAVRPRDRYFGYLESQLACKEKQFGIESPAFDPLLRENLRGRVAGKSFKTALRVLVVQAQHHARDQVEHASEQLPSPGLPLRLQFALQPARADGDISAGADRVNQLGRFLDRRRHVRVAEKADLTAGVQHAIANAVALAMVAGIVQNPQYGFSGHETAHYLDCVVARTVIHHDDFRVPLLLSDVCEDALQRGADPGALVVSRNDDAIGHISFQPPPRSSYLGRNIYRQDSTLNRRSKAPERCL